MCNPENEKEFNVIHLKEETLTIVKMLIEAFYYCRNVTCF